MEYEEYLEQGEILAGEGLIEEALSRFEQALAAAPENPEVIEAVGRALLNLDRLEEAEASFLDALELDPEWVAPRMGLALVALRRDEPFKIVHHLERAIEADPEYPDAYVELGRYYGSMAEPALAKATFERWTARHPEDADMLINAGLTAFDAADFAQAFDFFEKAVEAASGDEQKSGARTFRAKRPHTAPHDGPRVPADWLDLDPAELARRDDSATAAGWAEAQAATRDFQERVEHPEVVERWEDVPPRATEGEDADYWETHTPGPEVQRVLDERAAAWAAREALRERRPQGGRP